jgi:hypothetical protein
MSENSRPGNGQPNLVSEPKYEHGPYETQGEKFNDHPLDHPALNHDEPEQLGLEPARHLWSDHVDTIA